MKRMKKRVLALLCCLCLFVTNLPVGAQAAGAPFADVKQGDWMFSAVEYVREHNLMSGTGTGRNFSPNATLTRSMFVTILGRLAGVDKQNYPGTSFSDVKAGEWYAPYVEWASRKGVTSGIGNGKFGVENAITRQEMASMVNRYLDIEGLTLAQAENVLPGFTDSGDIASWAAANVEALRKTGLFKGNEKGQFLPQKSALRSEAAVVFTNLHKALQAVLEANPEVFYSITGITCEGGEAFVTVSTTRSAQVSLRILSEDGSRVLASGTAMAKGGLAMEDIAVELSGELPEYFLAQASLLDDSGASLCDTYTSRVYTQAYEQFEALEVTDFPEEKVLNLDEASDNNFMVVSDSVTLVEEADGAAVEQAPDGSYTITGAGDIAPGSRIVVQDGENTLMLVARSAEDGTVVAGVEDSPDFAEYFDLAKIDAQLSGQPELLDEPQAQAASARGIFDWELEPIDLGSLTINEDGSLPIPIRLTAEAGPLNLDVDGDVVLRVHFQFYYSAVLFGKDYLSLDFHVTVDQTTDAKVGLKVEYDDKFIPAQNELRLMTFLVPLGPSGLAAKVDLTLPVDWSIEGGMHLVMTSSVQAGFQFILNGNNQGLHPYSSNHSTATATVEAEGSIKLGPKLAVGLTYLTVFNGELNVFAGVVLKGVLSHPLGTVTNVAQAGVHACQLCVDGEVNTSIIVGAEAGVEILGFFEANVIDEEIPVQDEHLLDYYVSLENDGESVHGGDVTFGLDDCPNFLWRVDFSVVDSAGNVIEATVDAPGAKIPGKNCGLYYPGDYTASVTVDGQTYTKDFAVINGPKTVSFVVQPAYLQEYAKILRNLPKISGSNWYFGLAYIDNDDIPELLACGSGSHVSLTDIYFYKNGKIIKQEMGTAYGTFRFSPRTGMLWRWDLSHGYVSQSFGTLGASGYQSSIYFTNNDGTVSDPRETKYWIRDQEVSKGQYERELRKAQEAYKWVQFAYGSSTDSHKATSANINGMLENPQQYILSKIYTPG